MCAEYDSTYNRLWLTIRAVFFGRGLVFKVTSDLPDPFLSTETENTAILLGRIIDNGTLTLDSDRNTLSATVRFLDIIAYRLPILYEAVLAAASTPMISFFWILSSAVQARCPAR